MLRIVLIVVGVLAAISLGIALSQTIGNPQNAFVTTVRAIANLVTSIIIVLGNIVVIFAIIEWGLFRAGGKLAVKAMPKEKD